MVEYFSYNRKDRGRHRGSHYSSHDSRRRYLSDEKIKYLEKSSILAERAQRHSSKGSDGHRGSMIHISSALHQSDIPCSKWEILFIGRSRHLGKGSNPKESSGRGRSPKERTTL
jgi:hypothetical protein